MDLPSYATIWGPGYIGLTIALFLYGVEICQFVFYLREFRRDRVITKLQVYIVAALDSVHFIAIITSFSYVLIRCRMNTSPACSHHIPSTITLSILLVYLITFTVQVFYANRVWIISGQNIAVTLAVLASTTLQLVLGLMVVIEIIKVPTDVVLYSSKYPLLSSAASALCDAIITISVTYYLRPASIRREDFINKLLIVSVEMGLFTFINALAMVILYSIQRQTLGQFLASAPGVILSESYVNSMLAVLNARKSIRNARHNAWTQSIEVPTFPTTIMTPEYLREVHAYIVQSHPKPFRTTKTSININVH